MLRSVCCQTKSLARFVQRLTVFFSLVLQLLLIVQPPEHVALFSHCHASQCVFVNTHLPKHTNTLSPTRLQATFLLMHPRVTSTEMNHLLI